MSELQFPPSSPVLNAADLDFDPFSRKKDAPRGRIEYPTPNPSSTVGRSSSPARNGFDDGDDVTGDATSHFLGVSAPETLKKVTFETLAPKPRATVSINRDFNILNPDASVVRIPLLSGSLKLLVGRSSKSCDFHIKSADRTVSRIHVRINYDATTLEVTCVGHNGFGMIVPRVCEVSKASEGVFELRETGKPLQAPKLSKTIHLDYQHTEFRVNRGETVRMPRFGNVLLQISNQVLLVNPDDYDEEVTDDEAVQDAKQTAITHKAEVVAPMVAPAAVSVTPVSTQGVLPKTPRKSAKETVLEEQTPIRVRTKETRFKIFEDAPQARVQPPERALTPLATKSGNVPSTPPAKRRAMSEEPSGGKRSRTHPEIASESHKSRESKESDKTKENHKLEQPRADSKEPERDAEGKLVIDSKCIAHVSNLDEIENILINHLAFSRLSSTPASYLNTILATVSKLSLQELRLVLHGVECIGVIYRLGKDAAGKPLEEEYYYVPEKDRDPERNKLVSLIKGHGGLRACRRTHKQYYWKRPAPIKK